MFNKLINRLPDNYNKNENSINGKLYKIYARELEDIRRAFEDIKRYQDVDQAIDKTLDHIGKNVLQLRNTEDDELYRLFIKTKIIANLSKGDIETINEVARVLVGEGFVGVAETWNQYDYDYEPAGIIIKLRNHNMLIPYESLDRVIGGGIKSYWELGVDEIQLILNAKQEILEVSYPMCGTFLCGTKPYVQNQGISISTGLNVNTNKIQTSQKYKMTGTFRSGEAKL